MDNGGEKENERKRKKKTGKKKRERKTLFWQSKVAPS